MVDLGRLALAFGRVNRSTCHPDGVTPESDTDHTVMLGLIGCALAQQYFPDLDRGLIAQYILVHDVTEVYADDTCTLRSLSPVAQAQKERREQEAAQRISSEFSERLPWVPDMVAEYEDRKTPEARFVKALDKLMPKITQILNGATTVLRAGMTAPELATRHQEQVAQMREYAADFPALFEVLEVLIGRVLTQLSD
jgi:putative hydrolase of HD superfamily